MRCSRVESCCDRELLRGQYCKIVGLIVFFRIWIIGIPDYKPYSR